MENQGLSKLPWVLYGLMQTGCPQFQQISLTSCPVKYHFHWFSITRFPLVFPLVFPSLLCVKSPFWLVNSPVFPWFSHIFPLNSAVSVSGFRGASQQRHVFQAPRQARRRRWRFRGHQVVVAARSGWFEDKMVLWSWPILDSLQRMVGIWRLEWWFNGI